MHPTQWEKSETIHGLRSCGLPRIPWIPQDSNLAAEKTKAAWREDGAFLGSLVAPAKGPWKRWIFGSNLHQGLVRHISDPCAIGQVLGLFLGLDQLAMPYFC